MATLYNTWSNSYKGQTPLHPVICA